MSHIKKFQNKLMCICENIVFFEIIPKVECDWGIHTIIQCPKCKELFSIDNGCPAFQTIAQLLKENTQLYTHKEQFSYFAKSHPS